MSGDNFLKKHSLVLDLVILRRTVRVVFRFPPGDPLLQPVQEGNGLCRSEGEAFERSVAIADRFENGTSFAA